MGKGFILCLSVLIFYFAITNSTPIEGDSSKKDVQKWYNWYDIKSSTAEEANTVCGADKEYFYSESSQRCYKVHTKEATWDVAEVTCVREGGHLAVINSRDEAEILAKRFPSGFRVVHMGYLWSNVTDSWVTVSGQSFYNSDSISWAEGEPNNITGDQNCASMYPNGSFDDISCSDKTAFICEKNLETDKTTTEAQNFETTVTATVEAKSVETTEAVTTEAQTFETNEASTAEANSFESTKTDCTSNKEESSSNTECTDKEYTFFTKTQSCYKVHTDRATWNNAEATCVREGGHLAVINSREEANYLAILIRYNPGKSDQAYIGFHWKDGSWKTIQGQTFTEVGYKNWAVYDDDDEPMNKYELDYCGTIIFTGYINYIICNHRNIFICEKALNSEPLSTITTEVQSNFDTTQKDTPVEKTSKQESWTESTTVKELKECDTTGAGYKYYEKTNTCYKFHTESMTWDAAEATCVREGGHLAVITSQEETEYIHEYCNNNPIWLGILHKNGSWVTIHDQPVTEVGYENWGAGEPTQFYSKNCCYMNEVGMFSNLYCGYELGFVCEKDPKLYHRTAATEPTNFASVEKDSKPDQETESTSVETHNECGTTDPEYKFFESSKSCYKVHTEQATWDEAEATCVREGGHLAVVNSQDEADYFIKHFPYYTYQIFLGFYRKGSSWVTLQGEPLSKVIYEHWIESVPNQIPRHQNCGSMYADGQFDQISCLVQLLYICERKSDFGYPDTTTETQNLDDWKTDSSEKQTSVTEVSTEPTSNKPVSKCGTTDTDTPVEKTSKPGGWTASARDATVKELKKCGTTDAEYKYFESTKTCYKFHTEPMTWDAAEATCVREGGHLAIINSRDEADILSALYPRNADQVYLGFWLDEGHWVTVQGQLLSETGYVNWNVGEPKNKTEDQFCGSMNSCGTFDNISCMSELAFICEKNSKAHEDLKYNEVALRYACRRERNYRDSRMWVANHFGDTRQYEEARKLRTPSCEKLQMFHR